MSKNKGYTVLCGEGGLLAAAVQGDASGLQSLPALAPFDESVLDFLGSLSASLLKHKEAKAYPDVITFAFFCRKASLTQLRQEYGDVLSARLGRGLVFHIAPSNVPINFAYSLVSALLSGNASIVKASSQDFPQTRMVCEAMEALLTGDFQALRPYVNVITYPREAQGLTVAFSGLCDVRVIWGGDETVGRVREAALAPRAFDVTFADRYSLLCVSPSAVLAMEEARLSAMAQGFYNDTFLSDQNACTAPRLIYWLETGKAGELQAAQERFWQAVHGYADLRYSLEPVVAVDKLTALCRGAVILSGATRVPMGDNLITRLRVSELRPSVLDLRCPGGFFVEYEALTLEGLKAIISPKVQTLSYLGVSPEVLWAFLREQGLRGIDRIVPLGKTMDFSLTWDGYDLIRTLSRQVQIL